MKPFKSLFILAIVCAPALASAQGYYGNGGQGSGNPYGFHHRMGRLAFGFGLGLGFMHDDGSGITSCDNCDFKPYAFEADIHLGGMITPRFALMFEGQGNLQTIDRASGFDGGNTTLTQGAAMIAGQFWVIPQLWLKGGLGFSHLQVDNDFFTDDLGGGLALMAAAGFEVFSARNFAIDIQGRLIEGTYNGGDDHVTSGTIGVGFDWY